MNVYIDLSIINFIVLSILSLFIVSILCCYKYKIADYIIISLLSVINIVFLYDFSFLLMVLYFLAHTFVFFRKLKWNCLSHLFLYLFLSTIIPLFILLFVDSAKLINYHVFIVKENGIVIVFLYVLIGLIFFVMMKIVDSLFHLHTFKEKVLLIINEKKYVVNAYFDSGNFARHNNIPIVFVKNGVFDKNIFNKKMKIETISGEKELKYVEILISRKFDSQYTYVYLCLDDSIGSYQGCDLLLNAHLL